MGTDSLTLIITNLASILGGGVIVKLISMWLSHRRAVDGDFASRSQTARDDFQIVVESLERRIKFLEQAEQDCEARNRDLEKKLRDLEARFIALVKRSPFYDPSEFTPKEVSG